MADSDTQQNQKISKFNSTLAILFRIDRLWQDAHHHSRSGQLIKWNWDLDRVWCELAADVKEDDEKDFKKFNDEIAKINKVSGGGELYTKLLEKEIFIRKLQNKQGKGVAYEESFEEYIEG